MGTGYPQKHFKKQKKFKNKNVTTFLVDIIKKLIITFHYYQMANIWNRIFVTKFDKTKFPHTFNFKTLKDHNSTKELTINFKFCPLI